MIHQIRKMVGLIIAIIRGFTPETTLIEAFKKNKVHVHVYIICIQHVHFSTCYVRIQYINVCIVVTCYIHVYMCGIYIMYMYMYMDVLYMHTL